MSEGHTWSRVWIAILLIAVLGIAFHMGKLAWGSVTLILVGVGAVEWARLGHFKSSQVVYYAIAVMGLGLLGHWLLVGMSDKTGGLYGTAMLFWLLYAPLSLLGVRITSETLHALVGALILVSAWMASIRLYMESSDLMLFSIAMVAVLDSAAFFVGRRYGKSRMAPNISPKKTWAGLAGSVGAAYFCAFAAWLLLEASIPLVALLLFTLAVLLLSVVGDLFESTVKRSANVSDSGSILLGHGGILDLVDGLLPVLPFVALIAELLALMS